MAVGALLVLGDSASAFAADRGVPLERIARRPSGLGTPAGCPLYTAGVPLSEPRPSGNG